MTRTRRSGEEGREGATNFSIGRKIPLPRQKRKDSSCEPKKIWVQKKSPPTNVAVWVMTPQGEENKAVSHLRSSWSNRMTFLFLNSASSSHKSRIFFTAQKLPLGNYNVCHSYEGVILDTCLPMAKVRCFAIWQIPYGTFVHVREHVIHLSKNAFYKCKKCCFT